MNLREFDLAGAAAQGWDDFARACGGSMEVSSAWLSGWKRRHRGRVRLFIVEDAAGRRLAQAAMTEGRHLRTLQDRLLLASGSEGLWAPAMQILLNRLGPGRYRQGSRWSVAPSQTSALAALPGVHIADVDDFIVHAVDFARWPDWDSYWRDVSKTVRQTVRVAETRRPGVAITLKTGREALGDVPRVVLGAIAVQRRKALLANHWRNIIHAGGTMLSCRDALVVAVVREHGRLVAAKAAVEFGVNSHLLTGGVRAGAFAGWCATKALLQRAHAQGPAAKLVLGTFVESLHDDAVGGGLLQARRAVRASALPAAQTWFDYDGHGRHGWR